MPTYSKKSEEALTTCHPDIQKVFRAVLADGLDHTVLEGFRGEEAQNEAFRQGRSRVRYPDGGHNKLPSRAVDSLPYPVEWEALKKGDMLAVVKAGFFAGYVMCKAKSLGVRLKWGGDWNKNFDVRDQKFNDWPHFELED